MQILGPKCWCSPFLLSRARTCPLISLSLVAYFRSTPASSDKWKKQWFGNPQDFEAERPSKTYVKYKTRQQRADAKKALKDIYFGSGSSRFTLKGEFSKTRRTKLWDDDPTENKYKRGAKYCDEDPTEGKNERGAKFWDDDPTESKRWEKNRDDDPTEKKYKRGPFRSDSKSHQRRKKNKTKRGGVFEEFDEDEEDDPRTHFEAKFGKRRYSWDFKSWEEAFSKFKKSSKTRNKWRTISDDDEPTGGDHQSYVTGSHSDRLALGLPVNGPLKIEEVKTAFRLSALKWHPDKHQGPSQALAEEKFKLCASAYKSLCSALSSRV